MADIRILAPDDIRPDMLAQFHHRQIIRAKYVKRNGQWEADPVEEIREWSAGKRAWIPDYLTEQLDRGGSVLAAFSEERLVGFCSVDGYVVGAYANLTMLFVDDEMQHKGIGRALFQRACQCARQKGAQKLFISAIPSLPTVAFYSAMGCVDAKEIIPQFVDSEDDRYLECDLYPPEVRYVEPADKAFWFRLDRHLSEEEFLKKVRDRQGYVLLENGLPKGILRYNLFWDNTPFCTLIYVKEDSQRKGYGRALMAHWESDMRRQGYGMVLTSTQVDEQAQHFYRKLGYKDCGGLTVDIPGYEQPMELFLSKAL